MSEINTPTLRFGEFDGEWSEKKLEDISDIFDGTHQTPKYVQEGVPFVSVENINDIDNTDKCISLKDFEKKYKIKPKKNDILMTRITAGIIGNTAIIKNNKPLGFYVSLALIRIKNKDIDTDFLSHLINATSFKRELHKRIIHTAFPKKINLGEIGKCKIYYSSKMEQQKIATFISTVDSSIEQLSKKEQLLRSYKKGVMQKIFSREIRFTSEDSGVFEDWVEKSLGDVCKINKGQQLNRDNLIDDGDYPAINGGISPSGYTDSWNTEMNTITVSEDGNSCGFINYIKEKFWAGGHCYCIKDLKSDINNLFLYQILKYNEQNIMRLRVGSGLPNIQKGEITNFKINLPPKKEQTKIANFLSSLDKQIVQVSEQLAEKKDFKKGLLQKMFV